jgi:hypothetical protein
MQTTGKLRYYDANRPRPPVSAQAPTSAIGHSEFLRTGRISRTQPLWLPKERRYLTYEEVAERTGLKLESAGERTHQRINGFHHSIQFPKMVFHRTLEQTPHLGYCHVTAASTLFSPKAKVKWSFYIANFLAEIGDEDEFFKRVNTQYSRMYFAVATESDPDQSMKIDRSIRKNGLLFRTTDPKEALKNVLMLGAPDHAVRAIIKSL